MKKYFVYCKTADELIPRKPYPKPELKLETEEEKVKLTWLTHKLCKDKQLRRFVSEIVDIKSFQDMLTTFREQIKLGSITIKLVKNDKNRYRFHVSDGTTIFDVFYADVEGMKKTFMKNVNK